MIVRDMNFIGVACVKNEEDIIEAFVRHNLVYLDRLLVLDHGSTDDTPSILKALQEEGLDLQILHDDSLGKFQGEKMTALMHQAAEQGARWVVLLDGDEFIRTADPSLPLPLPPPDSPAVLKVAHITYGAHSSDDTSERNPALRLRHRLKSEPCQELSLKQRQGHLKALVRRDIALNPETTVLQGNHVVLLGGRELESALCRDWTLAHFSLRSPTQYASKVVINALQKLCRGSMMADHSSFYFRHLESIRSDYQTFVKDFPTLLPAYIEKTGHPRDKVCDPLPYRGGPLRHTPVREELSRLMGNLVTYSETLARRQGESSPAVLEATTCLSFLLGWDDTAPSAQNRVDRVISLLVPQTVSFSLLEMDVESPISVEWRGAIGLVEIQELTLLRRNGGVVKMSGNSLQEVLEIGGDARFIPHAQYFTFIKEIGPATLRLEPGKNGLRGPWESLEVRFVYDTNPATIGIRFIQAMPLASDVEQRRLIVHLEKKVSELVTLGGFLRHQIDWICSLVFKKS